VKDVEVPFIFGNELKRER